MGGDTRDGDSRTSRAGKIFTDEDRRAARGGGSPRTGTPCTFPRRIVTKMSTGYHTPVLVEEVVERLAVDGGGRFVDGTVGGGGHTEAILEAGGSSVRVLAIDRDPNAIEAAHTRLHHVRDQVDVVQGNYSRAVEICEERGFGPVDGFLVDAGVSSRQIDNPDRGFSLRREGPLDMRMGPDAERVDRFLDRATAAQVAEVLREYGDLRETERFAREMLGARRAGQLETTSDLVDVVDEGSIRARRGTDPAHLVFQALRIAVNDELDHLRRAVERVPELVCSGGHAVFISFHSLEDRIVKHGFRSLAESCVCPPDLPVCGCEAEAEVEILTSSPIRPTDAEQTENPRARSARLRAVRAR